MLLFPMMIQQSFSWLCCCNNQSGKGKSELSSMAAMEIFLTARHRPALPSRGFARRSPLQPPRGCTP